MGFEATCHPVTPAWFGRHLADASWAPTPLLVFLVESGLLKTLKVREAIVSFGRQTKVWLPDGTDEACSVIGKFTQGSVADGKRLAKRLVIDQGSSISWSVTHGKVAPWWEHPKSAPWAISSRITMGPSPSTPT